MPRSHLRCTDVHSSAFTVFFFRLFCIDFREIRKSNEKTKMRYSNARICRGSLRGEFRRTTDSVRGIMGRGKLLRELGGGKMIARCHSDTSPKPRGEHSRGSFNSKCTLHFFQACVMKQTRIRFNKFEFYKKLLVLKVEMFFPSFLHFFVRKNAFSEKIADEHFLISFDTPLCNFH